MRMRTGGGMRRAGWLALLVVVVLPELAAAQANALFPDIYIKRKRECSAHEDPQYSAIREQYYGYFPTCWRRFPTGWGCPSADAPNWEEALAKLPLEMPQEQPVTDPFTDPGAVPEGALPDLPREDGSLFPGTPGQPSTAPGADPAAPRTNAPDPFTPTPGGPRAGLRSDDALPDDLAIAAAGDDAVPPAPPADLVETTPPADLVETTPTPGDYAARADLIPGGPGLVDRGLPTVEPRRRLFSKWFGQTRKR